MILVQVALKHGKHSADTSTLPIEWCDTMQRRRLSDGGLTIETALLTLDGRTNSLLVLMLTSYFSYLTLAAPTCNIVAYCFVRRVLRLSVNQK